MQAALLGPDFSPDDIRSALDGRGARYEQIDESNVADQAAELIADGKIVGWFQGRMEFGPRALGASSILADARSPEMQSRLNQKIKFREGFRPFAPSVMSERTAEFFELDVESPYMTLVAPIVASRRRRQDSIVDGLSRVNEVRSEIPAVTHLDYSARVQTVSREQNPVFHGLISSFADRTGCPLVINTSFNVRGEPIVCNPSDALACFARTAIDALVIGPFMVRRDMQSGSLRTEASAGALGLD
jgi:carbamoyltransferase